MTSDPLSPLDDLAIAAIGYSPSDEEIEAASQPPYPTPAAFVPFQEAVRAALHARVARGPDPFCTTRLYEPAARFSVRAPYDVNSHLGFNVSDAICILLAGGLIPVATAQRAIRASASKLVQGFLQRATVYRLLADGDLSAAMEAAASPNFDQEQWVGWRAIGEYHAARADAFAFLSLWPKYEARQEREWVDNMRRQLVDAVSRTYGWRDALALTRDKRIGVKGHVHGMAYVALRPLTEKTTVSEVNQLLGTASELVQFDALNDLARLKLLVDALRASTPRAPADDPPGLDAVLSRIIAVDPTASKQQSQRRDWLLMDCWPLIGNAATLKRVRAAIRAPLYKRELSMLAKDAAPAVPIGEKAIGA